MEKKNIYLHVYMGGERDNDIMFWSFHGIKKVGKEEEEEK